MEFVLTGGTVIDGTGANPVPDAAIHVKDGRIAWVGPVGQLAPEAASLPQEDVTGKTIIPGLVDPHIHICFNGRESVFVAIVKDRDTVLLEAVDTVRRVLAQGTTSIRDIGGWQFIEMSIRKAINNGWIQGPRMRTSGHVIAMTGGHAHFIAREADGPLEITKAAREQIKAGADTIKMMATGGTATPGQDIMASQLTVEELKAAADVAHAMGRTAAAHAHGTGGIKNCVLAGIDTIEHCTFLTEETAEMMKEKGTWAVFTQHVSHPNFDDVPPGLEKEADRLRGALDGSDERAQKAIGLAKTYGLNIACGTDAGGHGLSPHDFSMQHELELLVQNGGFTPLEAISIGTCQNARVLRWEDQIGTLETGKWADMVVLTADPLENISNLRAVEAVYKGGERVQSRE